MRWQRGHECVEHGLGKLPPGAGEAGESAGGLCSRGGGGGEAGDT